MFIAHCQRNAPATVRQQLRIDGKSKALVGSEDLPVLNENVQQVTPCAIVTVRAFLNSLTAASWALAQRIGYLYSGGRDCPPIRHSNGCDIQRQVGRCQTMTGMQADFEARLEAVFHQNTGGRNSLRRISINPSIFSRFRKECPQMKIS